jgi:MFS family permease
MIAQFGDRGVRGRWLYWACLTFPVFLCIFAFETFFPFSLLLAFGLGFGFMVQFTMINTLLQTRVEDDVRGRVMSLYTITFFGFAPFGNLAIGALSEQMGLSNAIALFAAFALLLAWIVLRRIPRIRTLP